MSPAAAARSVVHVMSAGAARGLVDAVKSSFESDAGVRLSATFGAVGTIRELLATDARCDVVILTAAALEPLVRGGRIDATSLGMLGHVHTGIAVKKRALAPAIGDAAALRDAFLGAPALFIPDPERATAGIHCVAVLKRLGIAGEMAPRLRAYPHGAAAMQALARCADEGAIGCTQVTEIKYTPGVALVGSVPPPFALSTPYAVAVTTRARDGEHARSFAAWLSGEKTAALRTEGGFEIS